MSSESAHHSSSASTPAAQASYTSSTSPCDSLQTTEPVRSAPSASRATLPQRCPPLHLPAVFLPSYHYPQATPADPVSSSLTSPVSLLPLLSSPCSPQQVCVSSLPAPSYVPPLPLRAS